MPAAIRFPNTINRTARALRETRAGFQVL